MAEKKYYWLKLGDEFFGDKTIKKLRKIAGGDTYTIIYLKMLLLAVKQNNRLYFEGVEETFPAELALELDEDVENVAVTCSFLEKKGLLKVMSEEEFILTQCDEMVGSETDAAVGKGNNAIWKGWQAKSRLHFRPEKHRYNFSTDWWMICYIRLRQGKDGNLVQHAI